jgi:hypothetical protein
MKKILLAAWLITLAFPFLAHAQSDLTPDQQVLLDDIRRAFELRDTWESYSLVVQDDDNFAMTLVAGDSQQWATISRRLAITADYDLAKGRVSGTASLEQTAASPDNTSEPLIESIRFVILEDQVFVGSEDDDLAEIDADSDPYQMFEFGRIGEFEAGQPLAIPARLLDEARGVFDLGVVENPGGQRIQSYQVELDFATSLPLIPFDLDSFIQPFNGVVELGALTDTLVSTSQLNLFVQIDLDSEQVLETLLIINLAADMTGEIVVAAADGNGYFSLTYGQEYRLNYQNVNQVFEIEAP